MTSKEVPFPRKVSSSAPFYDYIDITGILEDIRQILKSKRLVLGPFTRRFEELFSNYIGTKYGIAVNSATAALQIVLTYFDIKDYEVIVPCNTFIACPNSIIYAGGRPVFADMDPDSFCIDINDVQKKITSKTRAIMAVHLAGLPEPHIDALGDICHDRKILLMEDCSHAHGASFNGKKVGSLAHAGCFSLFATKIMAIGTGGIITTDNEKLKLFAEALRHQGGLGGEGQIEVFDKLGYDWMMNEVTAVLAISQLERLDEQIERRRKIAELYRTRLSRVAGIRCLPNFDRCKNVYWKFITLLDENIGRDQVRARLRKDFGIEGGILYPTLCHLQPVYQNLGYGKGQCPVAEKVMTHQLTLPVNPYMTEEDVDYVVNSLNSIIHG